MYTHYVCLFSFWDRKLSNDSFHSGWSEREYPSNAVIQNRGISLDHARDPSRQLAISISADNTGKLLLFHWISQFFLGLSNDALKRKTVSEFY